MGLQGLAALLLDAVQLHLALHQGRALGRFGDTRQGGASHTQIGVSVRKWFADCFRRSLCSKHERTSGAPGAMPTRTSHLWSGDAR